MLDTQRVFYYADQGNFVLLQNQSNSSLFESSNPTKNVQLVYPDSCNTKKQNLNLCQPFSMLRSIHVLG